MSKHKPIEKLEKDYTNYSDPFGGFDKKYDPEKMGDKLNELIEAVNTLRKEKE